MSDWIRKNDGRNDTQIREYIASNGVSYLYYPALANTGIVSHAFSTRKGGVSKGSCATMNLSFTRKSDTRENVLENYHRMADALGVEFDSFVLTYQTHATNVLPVTRKERGFGITKERTYTDIDGLITNQKGVTLVTFFADCIPLYFVDPVHYAIGLAHSGWRGTVAGMVSSMLEAMKKQYGTKAKEVIVAIGPGICSDCYEISLDVAKQFEEAFGENAKQILYGFHGNHCQLDLWRANEIWLLESGVQPENIHISNICTHCNSDLLFSHRKHGEDRGNLAAFLALK